MFQGDTRDSDASRLWVKNIVYESHRSCRNLGFGTAHCGYVTEVRLVTICYCLLLVPQCPPGQHDPILAKQTSESGLDSCHAMGLTIDLSTSRIRSFHPLMLDVKSPSAGLHGNLLHAIATTSATKPPWYVQSSGPELRVRISGCKTSQAN